MEKIEKEKRSHTELVIVSIVAIVAIVGLVMMFSGMSQIQTVPFQESEVGEETIIPAEEGDLAGMAYYTTNATNATNKTQCTSKLIYSYCYTSKIQKSLYQRSDCSYYWVQRACVASCSPTYKRCYPI